MRRRNCPEARHCESGALMLSPCPSCNGSGSAVVPVRLRQSLTTRQGRKVARMLYEQRGPEPAGDDPIIGLVDTPELAALIVAAVNAWRPEGDGCRPS